jgi:hypothetical protein
MTTKTTTKMTTIIQIFFAHFTFAAFLKNAAQVYYQKSRAGRIHFSLFFWVINPTATYF